MIDYQESLIEAYEKLRPYHTPSVLLLVLTVVLEFFVDVPAAIWWVFVVLFSVMLAGNLLKQRRESPYA